MRHDPTSPSGRPASDGEHACDATISGRRGAWSSDEVRKLVTLWPTHSNAQIAQLLKRNENAIAIKASRLGLPPRVKVREDGTRDGMKNPKARVRPCLCCKTPFYSDGAHHRICDGCKSGSGWQSGGSPYVVSLGDF